MANVLIDENTMTNIANAIREKAGNSTTLLPSEMPDAIVNLPSGGGGEGFNRVKIEGNLQDLMGNPDIYPTWKETFFREHLHELIQEETGVITHGSYAFYYMKNADWIKVINFDTSSVQGIFDQSDRTTVPIVKGTITNIGGLIPNSEKVTEIPDECFAEVALGRSYSAYKDFSSKYYIRNYGTAINNLIRNQALNKTVSAYLSSNNIARAMYSGNYNLKYALIPVPTDYTSRGMILEDCNNCHQLEEMEFVGPMLYLSTNVSISFQGNGIGYWEKRPAGLQLQYVNPDLEVIDLESYENFKDDPDWWTCDPKFSHFNHDSVVKMFESLPKVVNSSGTSYTASLHFNGECASGYGKAIADLTDTEKAIVQDKGWELHIY